MIADFKPYAEYKESGLPWLGRVPGHWETRKLKHVTQFVNGLPFKPGDWKAAGVPIIRIQNLNGSDAFNYTNRDNLPAELLIQPGDLMFAWSGNRGTSFGPFQWNRQFSGYLNQHIFKLVGHTLPNRYFYYVLRAVTRHVEEQAGGIIGLVHVTKPELGSVRVSLAPPSEQAAIVRFLDWANGRLERAIRAKRKVIALLNEQKQAIIHRAVTRGLDPSVPLKPSGIPWLGDIPQHWGIVRNLALFSHRIEQGIPGFPVLQVSLHSGITAEELDQFGRPKRLIADHTKYKLIRKHDLAYNTMRMWQGAVGVCPTDGLVSPAYVVIRPRTGSDPAFYEFVFRTAVYKQEVNRHSTGIVSDRNRLYWESFKQMPNVLLPIDEQQEICRFIQEATSGLNTAISRLEREIELLREYRTRLVADAVTGKLDVREAATQLPDEAPPETAEDDTDLSDEPEAADEEAAV